MTASFVTNEIRGHAEGGLSDRSPDLASVLNYQPIARSRAALVCLRLLVAALLLSSSPVIAELLTGRVVRVADGDTITVLDDAKNQHRIRLQGIDAPERGQSFGNASRKHLASLVAGKTVTIEWFKRDRYGRIVGKIWLGGLDVGLAQIRAGYAWHFRFYANEQAPEDRAAYARAEDEAREKRLGLWAEEAIAPWDWRRQRRLRDHPGTS